MRSLGETERGAVDVQSNRAYEGCANDHFLAPVKPGEAVTYVSLKC